MANISKPKSKYLLPSAKGQALNQKGEAILFCSLCLVVLSGLMLLLVLELRISFQSLQKRSALFLCTKEAKGELNLYLKFMGRTNWGIRNIERASLIMLFIPGLQGAAGDAQKAKEAIQLYQNFRLASYLKTLASLRQKSCSLDPRMFITPFMLGGLGYQRDESGAALLRNEKWDYFFVSRPFSLKVSVDASGAESMAPKLRFTSSENGVMLSSLLSSR
jgi:hypothetical protein